MGGVPIIVGIGLSLHKKQIGDENCSNSDGKAIPPYLEVAASFSLLYHLFLDITFYPFLDNHSYTDRLHLYFLFFFCIPLTVVYGISYGVA